MLKSDARRLLQSFETVQDVFGATEANKIFANVSTLSAEGTVETKGQMRDTSVEIVDVDGSPAAPGIDGILRVRNAYMAKGYLGDAAAGQQAFRDGWFYPGDVASWGPEGTLLIRDRTGNVFNIGGLKINALIVDQIFRSVNGILDAACFKNPKDGAIDELFAFVVFADGCNRIQAAEIARQRCRERLGQVLVPVSSEGWPEFQEARMEPRTARLARNLFWSLQGVNPGKMNWCNENLHRNGFHSR